MASPLHTAIIGAGASGLYTAWRLVTAGNVPAGDVRLFEGSDRICGRLMSARPPHMPNLHAELGGMRYLNSHSRVVSLVNRFGLTPYDFPTSEAGPDGDPDYPPNIAWLRGHFFRERDYPHPERVPFRLGPNEQGKSPGQLVIEALEQILPGVSAMTEEERREAVKTATFDGRPLYTQGLWQVLYRVMSSEAYALAMEGGGYDSTLTSWNAADAIPWFLADFNTSAKYFSLREGYDAILTALGAAYEQVGEPIRLNQWLKAFDVVSDPEHGRLVELHIEGEPEPVRARHLVLAMPRRSLEMLDPTGALLGDPRVRQMIASVTPHPMFKLFCAYETPWWKAAGVCVGKANTDLPVRQCYYFGTVDEVPGWTGGKNTHSLAMASYDDGQSVGFWDSLRPKRRRGKAAFTAAANPADAYFHQDQQPRAADAVDRGSRDWARRPAPKEMVAEVQRQLAEVHGLEYIPEPYSAAFMDWGEDPWGGGWNSWNIGVESWKRTEEMIQPVADLPVFISGEAYSQQQGWVEGALETAERVLQRGFGVSPE